MKFRPRLQGDDEITLIRNWQNASECENLDLLIETRVMLRRPVLQVAVVDTDSGKFCYLADDQRVRNAQFARFISVVEVYRDDPMCNRLTLPDGSCLYVRQANSYCHDDNHSQRLIERLRWYECGVDAGDDLVGSWATLNVRGHIVKASAYSRPLAVARAVLGAMEFIREAMPPQL